MEKFLKQCTACARYHRGSIPRRRRRAGLQPTLVGEPWERISVDITGLHPRTSQEQMAEAYEVARRHLGVAAQRRKAAYDIRVHQDDFKVGDWVWYWYPRKYSLRSPKWQKCYTGPYLIVRKIEPVNFVLQRSSRAKPFVVHINKMKKCFGPTPVSWLTVEPGGVLADGCAPRASPRVSQSMVGGNKNVQEESVSEDDVIAPEPVPLPRRRCRPRYLADYVC